MPTWSTSYIKLYSNAVKWNTDSTNQLYFTNILHQFAHWIENLRINDGSSEWFRDDKVLLLTWQSESVDGWTVFEITEYRLKTDKHSNTFLSHFYYQMKDPVWTIWMQSESVMQVKLKKNKEKLPHMVLVIEKCTNLQCFTLSIHISINMTVCGRIILMNSVINSFLLLLGSTSIQLCM